MTRCSRQQCCLNAECILQGIDATCSQRVAGHTEPQTSQRRHGRTFAATRPDDPISSTAHFPRHKLFQGGQLITVRLTKLARSCEACVGQGPASQQMHNRMPWQEVMLMQD